LAAEEATLRAILEAIVYVTDEPPVRAPDRRGAGASGRQSEEAARRSVEEFAKPAHGLSIRELAGGYQMATKAEHHEAVRAFVKKLTPPLKLSLPALETLAVIAYKQPVTTPESWTSAACRARGVLKTCSIAG